MPKYLSPLDEAIGVEEWPDDAAGRRAYCMRRIAEIQMRHRAMAERECEPWLQVLSTFPPPVTMANAELLAQLLKSEMEKK